VQGDLRSCARGEGAPSVAGLRTGRTGRTGRAARNANDRGSRRRRRGAEGRGSEGLTVAEIKAGEVAKLRASTGAGMMDCKKALTDADGDFDKARTLLRERGLADAAKRKGGEAQDGRIYAYLHAPQPGLPPKIGVMLELTTETD